METDIVRSLSYGAFATRALQVRTSYIVNHAKCKEWLTSNKSEFLVVTGDDNDSIISGTTVACGLLGRGIELSGGAIHLTFSCGL
jgi:hypothetical protein